VDEQANLAAAAAAAASLGMPVGLSSILPLAAALPVLPLKFLPTPALFAQAMEKATKVRFVLMPSYLVSAQASQRFMNLYLIT